MGTEAQVHMSDCLMIDEEAVKVILSLCVSATALRRKSICI